VSTHHPIDEDLSLGAPYTQTPGATPRKVFRIPEMEAGVNEMWGWMLSRSWRFGPQRLWKNTLFPSGRYLRHRAHTCDFSSPLPLPTGFTSAVGPGNPRQGRCEGVKRAPRSTALSWVTSARRPLHDATLESTSWS